MMKQVEGCTLVGQTSYGSSGNPKPHELGNGVTVWVPSWKSLDAKGICTEGIGIRPDIEVETVGAQFEGSDPVLEAARKHLSAVPASNPSTRPAKEGIVDTVPVLAPP